MPGDVLCLLAAAFLDNIKPSTPVRYNLADTVSPLLRNLGCSDNLEDGILRRHVEASYSIMQRSENLLLQASS